MACALLLTGAEGHTGPAGVVLRLPLPGRDRQARVYALLVPSPWPRTHTTSYVPGHGLSLALTVDDADALAARGRMHDLGGFQFKIGTPATDAVLHRYYAADTPHSHNLTDLVRSLLRSTEPDTGTSLNNARVGRSMFAIGPCP